MEDIIRSLLFSVGGQDLSGWVRAQEMYTCWRRLKHIIAQPQTLVSLGVSIVITLVLSTLLSLSLPIPVAVYQPSANL